MSQADQTIEQEIQAKGKTAPRVTPADIEANIASEHIFTAAEGLFGAECVRKIRGESVAEEFSPPALGLLTFCVLVLKNGYTVTGESACASPTNFNAEIGRKISRANAVEKCWPLMGYALKQPLADAVPVVEKKRPYGWIDVANYATFSNDQKACTEFVIQMKGDDRRYQGSVPDGLTESSFRVAAIAECNRQRDLTA